MCEITPLTPDAVRLYLERLLEIDQAVIAERWTPAHFAADLPGKWELSRLVVKGERPIGFMVATFKVESVHVNRIAVEAAYRGGGWGTRLLQDAARAAQQAQKPWVTLKVSRQNVPAINYYYRRGFHLTAESTDNLSLAVEPPKLLA
jgi:ribosomal protein S18 acetylase RimI-like enzyme